MLSRQSLVILVSLAWSGVMSVQRWEEQPSSSFVNPGGEVSLACRIANKKGDCRWEMRQEDGSTSPLGIYPGKREWAGDREQGDCSIRILEADYNIDNGRYVCQVRVMRDESDDDDDDGNDDDVSGDRQRLQRDRHTHLQGGHPVSEGYVIIFMTPIIINYAILFRPIDALY